MADIWTTKSGKAFQEESECIVKQYSQYTVQGQHVSMV